MKIGIGIPNQVRDVRPQVIPAWAAQAEAAGFSSLGTVGRIAYPGVMDTVALAAAAGATKSIGLMSGVMLATVWPAPLLAKELAAIDGVSGGRLTAGFGIGLRPDDFVVDGLGPKGLGARIDRDPETYRSVWAGQPVGGGDNPGVPAGTREVPMVFGGIAPTSFKRMAKWGQGYVGTSARHSSWPGTSSRHARHGRTPAAPASPTWWRSPTSPSATPTRAGRTSATTTPARVSSPTS
ncbi:LLM class flavin-dependent oxidoreductase [Amycolatopsis sp. NPDC049253]|uniref:LLM class flavin-dependent oxidoreductase n=1 Tax=Amycolatopsis sp. NPDC049253 TaxID=3155274 RepID=UPI003442CEFB